jgi:2-phospho-L-lactate/phosphoenolpyruvate guanylyltransferase
LNIFAIVPVKSFGNAKSRLGTVLDTHERTRLSAFLVERTICVLKKNSNIDKIILVSSDRRVEKVASRYGAIFLREDSDSGVNSAVNKADEFCIASGAEATLVLPIDLPLMIPEDIDIICKSALSDSHCMVICPSYKFDGSNVLLRKPCDIIGTSYDANSYPMHVLAGIRKNIKIRVLFLNRLMIDIDTFQDIKKMLAMHEKADQISRYFKALLTEEKLTRGKS